MDSEYDRKFEEMKNYIPFLENMIKRLETNSVPSNPRRAQLDKIRSLRDLLQDKRKRMKMENLLKCEQVLINLYKKVEQREFVIDSKSDSEAKASNSANLSDVRKKLKSVTRKLSQETLPEIARASDTEEVCVPGSKEPALFQRRPNFVSGMPTTSNKANDDSPPSSKKNYTRVLVSPDRTSARWSRNEDLKTDTCLFSRRSPKRETREEKRISRKSKEMESNDLNITLQVPKESLSSLSTDDILSRIINCNDNDVDISTLRELRSQILGELKNTGAQEGISDVLLKSYTNNSDKNKVKEIEEGELSDSESEAIESIYGGLVVVDKDKATSTIKTSLGKNKSRIQICLVINSDKPPPTVQNVEKENIKKCVDESEFESFSIEKKCESDEPGNVSVPFKKEIKMDSVRDEPQEKKDDKIVEEAYKAFDNAARGSNVKQIESKVIEQIKEAPEIKSPNFYKLSNHESEMCKNNTDMGNISSTTSSIDQNVENKSKYLGNKIDCQVSVAAPEIKASGSLDETKETLSCKGMKCESTSTNKLNKGQDSVDIPLLNIKDETVQREIVSEIDILQALKKEILGEASAVSDLESVTPPLHQPKITKVASAQEIIKKRISIENYKQKSNSSPKHLFTKSNTNNATKEDRTKKQSLKLTEKECERFNLPIKLPLNESSDDEEFRRSSVSADDIYSNLAPKSPDHEDFADTGIKPPVIIPIDPIEPPVTVTADIDMRKPRNIKLNDTLASNASGESPVQTRVIPNSTSVPSPNVTPLIPPNLNPLLMPNLTPNSRSFEMTPSRHAFENEDYPDKVHIYAPMFPASSNLDRSDQHLNDNRKWDENKNNSVASKDIDYRRFNQNDFRQDNLNAELRDSFNRLDCPPTANHPFGRLDCPSTPLSSFGRLDFPTTSLPSFGRIDCPSNPLPSFGRHEMPMTPVHPFGRSDGSLMGRQEMSMTPVHPFGRSDGSSTPVHPFGRADRPMTPVHPFGRTDRSITPVPSFSRTEMPVTPIHPFGRSDGSANSVNPFRSDYSQNYSVSNKKYSRNQDPRLNRRSDIDSYNNWEDDRDSRSYRDHKFNSGYKQDQRSYNSADQFRTYDSNTSKDESFRSRTKTDDRHSNDNQYERDRDYSARRPYSRDDDPRIRYSKNNKRNSKLDADYSNFSESKRGGFQRSEKNIGRDRFGDNKFSTSTSRDCNVNRDSNKNKQFIEQTTGRTFAIDTSINRTFQGDVNFNVRRQRAASVGRTVVRDSRERETTSTKSSEKSISESYNNRKKFSRACSVGREISKQPCDNLKDVKADLRSFKLKNDIISTKRNEKSSNLNVNDKIKELNKRGSSSEQRYSPRKNLRDPRLRRDSKYDNRAKETKLSSRDTKGYGIVYSDDNISKGTVLGTGTGVKNYKIPKIKRPSPEKTVTLEEFKEEKKEEENNKKDEDEIKLQNTSENNVKDDEKLEEESENKKSLSAEPSQNILDDVTLKNQEQDSIITRRVTRSTKLNAPKTETSVGSPVRRTRKSKKPVIYDSESDSEKKDETDTLQNKNISSPIKELKVKTSVSSQDEQNKNDTNDDLNSSFGDMFSDNIASDPVMDNINSLIEDLDHDLDASKNTRNEFKQELSLENMLENITTSDSSETEATTIAKDTLEVVTTHKNDVHPSIEENDTLSSSSQETEKDEKSNMKPLIENISKDNIEVKTDIDKIETVDSTTKDIVQDDPKKLSTENEVVPKDNNSVATPADADSTVNITKDVPVVETVPDSTNESSNDITSSNSKSDVSGKDSLQTTKNSDEDDSLGKLLTILQDKSKIKELLTILGKQSSENDKIKKKLEKLSEIVSDDDDDDNKGTTKDESMTESKNDDKQIKDAPEDPSPLTEIKNKTEKSVSPTQIIESKSEESESHTNDSSSLSVTPTEVEETEDSINEGTDTKILPKVVKNKVKMKIPKGNKKTKRKGLKKAPPKGVSRLGTNVTSKVKKPSRELLNLQADIREMFIKDDILAGTSGIRMCRLAKLVDEKSQNPKDEASKTDCEPIVRLEKFKNLNTSDHNEETDKTIKKKNIKNKNRSLQIENKNLNESCKSSSSKSLNTTENDPYKFESDSLSDFNAQEQMDELDNTQEHSMSEGDSDSAESTRSASTEHNSEVKKKPKRQRRAWQAGVIVPKNKKKKNQPTIKSSNTTTDESESVVENKSDIPDLDCFTDKLYCFTKNIITYPCRLCEYEGENIVNHYKTQHPHVEIPISRMSQDVAKEAIKQCDKIDLHSISKVPSNKFICRFCFKEFYSQKNLLENFFWHTVSEHTGEYRHKCTECVNDAKCPFNIDVPPPPTTQKGQLIGYVCGLCNYTQVSLENLKNHVVSRHNDKQTEVFTINMSHMSTKAMNMLLKRMQKLNNDNVVTEERRVLRRTRSKLGGDVAENKNDSAFDDETCDSASISSTRDINKKNKESHFGIHSKIAFENDSDTEKSTKNTEPLLSHVKTEPEPYPEDVAPVIEETPVLPSSREILGITTETSDIFALPHFKVNYTETGLKEYACCINNNYHYKTTLLISFKKHVQTKHAELWDGYCFLCKVIVTPQGIHKFSHCLQHFLDKHSDNFPVLEKQVQEPTASTSHKAKDIKNSPKPFLSVRPLSELISHTNEQSPSPLPIIESVVSLGTSPEPSVTHTSAEVQPEEKQQLTCEEAQADVMSKKNAIVLDSMMSHEKLAHVFKCAGRFCSFSTDNVNDALVHASTHVRVGGDGALKCAYCDHDPMENAIDLITHVFKTHGCNQYACGVCFYRAAASQLVHAHISRMHADAKAKTILRASYVTESASDSAILPRGDAVPYYICNYEDGENEVCKFKTYTPSKYCEHIKLKHSSATIHKCYVCQEVSSSIAGLIHHLKAHGLKLYQCVWCVHGADNETELLAHASSKHPSHQPQAYLRVITNKEGTSEYRVLPLAYLNKSDVPFIEIPASATGENPVKEAERSVDLEKLIGQTSIFINSGANSTPATTEASTNEDQNADNGIILEASTSIERPITPNIPVIPLEQTTPVVKSESLEATPVKTFDSSDIVCLDSDDEDDVTAARSAPAKEKTSTEMTSKEPVKFPPQLLYMCSKCNVMSKNRNVFKNHLQNCYPASTNDVPCAYCLFKGTKPKLIAHYTSTHLLKADTVNFHCSNCPEVFPTLMQSKEHQKNAHKVTSYKITSKRLSNGEEAYVTGDGAKKNTARRKRSIGSAEKVDEPPAKLTKFGPQDIDKLPINPIFDYSVTCSLCEFSTKVRLNMVRHLQLHANQQPVPQTAPVNPVPHLETNEKHFDKMVNLASSSLTVRAQEKSGRSDNPIVAVLISPEEAARYPKYVPERQRLTCGAVGCSYISVDENMLKYHWETLHSGTTDFHCVHCPSNQHLDTSVTLTASRVIAHLRMHDIKLYACSLCSYYHYRRQLVEKHQKDVHPSGNVMIVREEVQPQASAAFVPSVAAPTMDLKPWQCGICEFKSLLRPEVVEHCASNHQSKMQFRCGYCAFRTSNMENIAKHQSLSHQGKPEKTFYYYYREGSMPNVDGVPFWKAQRIIYNLDVPQVKTEAVDTTHTNITQISSQNDPVPEIDLNIVKKEITAPEDRISSDEDTIEELCKRFGQFCEPNGLKYKCPLCKNAIEDTKDTMQSHLYEELQYRKWGCSICYYKAFHERGLSEHMQAEHHQNREPVELPVDRRVETWVTKLLAHQEAIIEMNKVKLAQQKAEILRQPPAAEIAAKSVVPAQLPSPADRPNLEELVKKFGPLGEAVNMAFCCPKCKDLIKEEANMRDHLESELNKIRWCCSACPLTFQSYHQAQFHCKTHTGLSSRPLEAPRDSALRMAWVDAVLEAQKASMDVAVIALCSEEKPDRRSPEQPENSLLVVRYEERVSTPEVETRKIVEPNSEEDRLVIDEPLKKRRKKVFHGCPHCTFTTVSPNYLNDHVLRHYGLQAYTCAYCKITGTAKHLSKHQKTHHSMNPPKVFATPIPTEIPSVWNAKNETNRTLFNLVCLTCQEPMNDMDTKTHVHDATAPEFGKIGEVVIKCTTCSSLQKNITKFFAHDKEHHDSVGNYVFYKLTLQKKVPAWSCSHCSQRFNLKKDLVVHLEAAHADSSKSKFQRPKRQSKEVIVLDDDADAPLVVEDVMPPRKKVARKSTTKLPQNESTIVRTVARKSTARPPNSAAEYSYYGTKPSLDNLENVTTLMPIYNKLMPVSYQQLVETLDINPLVRVVKLGEDDLN